MCVCVSNEVEGEGEWVLTYETAFVRALTLTRARSC